MIKFKKYIYNNFYVLFIRISLYNKITNFLKGTTKLIIYISENDSGKCEEYNFNFFK